MRYKASVVIGSEQIGDRQVSDTREYLLLEKSRKKKE
jgi:hypothetical protein